MTEEPPNYDNVSTERTETNLASGTSAKVLGELTDDGAAGVFARNATDISGAVDLSGINVGLFGTTDKSGTTNGEPNSVGVFGNSSATDGESIGVVGRAESANGVGVVANATENADKALVASGNADVLGDLDVDGTRSVGSIGVDAGRETDQSVSGDLSDETVLFDNAYTNDGSGYDTSTGVFTAPYAGAYQIDAQVELEQNDLSTGDRIFLEIDGGFRGGGGPGNAQAAMNFQGGTADPTLGVSRTFFGLESGDTLEVQLSADSTGGVTINGNRNVSFLTIAHLG
jgi:hypothetical protein